MEITLNGPEYRSSKETKSICIFLHGWGSDGQDLITLADQFSIEFPYMSFYSPNAPDVCSMNPYGRQWFEISSGSQKIEDIGDNVSALNKFIDEKIKINNILENRVFLMGFSQGGMMSLHVGLRRENYIGGIISFSGALIFPDHLKEIKNGSPVLMVHGEDDEVVPFKEMNKGCNHLKDHNIEVETLGIPKLGHGINDLGIKQAIKFMKEKLEEK